MHCDKNSVGKNMICLFSRFDADVFVGFPQFCAEKCLDSSKRPFFLLLRQLFSVLTVNSFFAGFFLQSLVARSEVVFLNVTNLGHLESLTLLVLNFLKVLSIFYHLQKFNVYIYSCNKITNT